MRREVKFTGNGRGDAIRLFELAKIVDTMKAINANGWTIPKVRIVDPKNTRAKVTGVIREITFTNEV